MYSKVVFLLVILLKFVYGFQNCETDNQFKFFCMPIESCTVLEYSNGVCNFDHCGYYDNEATVLVKLGPTQIVPRCAFISSRVLRHIYGFNNNIRSLSARAFEDLSGLESINLSYNSITEIRTGVFNNVSATSLDLSWNRLVYIEKGAIDGLYQLKYLNLSKNELATVPMNYLGASVENLILSHNLLTTALLNSRKYRNLTSVDLSSNLIEKIAISFDYPIILLDVTRNELTNFDFIELQSIELIKMAFNEFTAVPDHLLYLNAKQIELYPNPWNCEKLAQLWNQFLRSNIKIKPSEIEEFKGKPICDAKNKTDQYPLKLQQFITKFKTHRKCFFDKNCPRTMICRSHKCWDPCKENLCEGTSICSSDNHFLTCTCPPGLKRNPIELNSPCYDVECFADRDCSHYKVCVSQRCILEMASNKGPSKHIPSTTPHEVAPSKPWWYDEIPKLVATSSI